MTGAGDDTGLKALVLAVVLGWMEKQARCLVDALQPMLQTVKLFGTGDFGLRWAETVLPGLPKSRHGHSTKISISAIQHRHTGRGL